MASSALSQLTPEEMANTPAGVPPPGVTPNLIDPPSEGYLLIVVGSVVMGIMLVTAGLRFYTRIFIRRRTGADDWTTLIAVIGACGYFIACIIAVVKGRYGTHMWDLSVAHAMSDTFIISGYFINWLTAIIWPFAKSSFFLMYLDLFKILTWQRAAIYFGLVVNWGFYLSIVIATLYFTSPAPGQTWQESFVSPRYAKALTMTIPIAAGSLVLDIYILILPILAIWGLRMELKKKLGVLAVFATGTIACVASSLSIYFKNELDHHTEDFSYYTLPVLIMCLVEMCVGITASCMPSMAQLFRTRGGLLTGVLSSIFRPFSSLRSNRKSTGASQGSTGSWPKKRDSRKKQYINMDDLEVSTGEHDYVKSVQTFGGGRSNNGLEEDGIHLKYGIVQNIQQDIPHIPHHRDDVV